MNGPSFPAAATVEVVDKKVLARGVVALDLADPSGARLPDWTPGAHIDLVLPHGVIRQYSLCGDRWDAHRFRVAVRHEENGLGGSGYIHERLSIGDRIEIGTPRNNFPLVPAEEYVFIAGGIGITPLVPMIHQIIGQDIPWRLLYAGRTRVSMAFADELEALGAVIAAGDEGRRLDLAAELAVPPPGAKLYCCGPPRLLEAVEHHARDWPRYSVRTERFVGAAPAVLGADQSFDVELARTGRRLTVRPGQSVLAALKGFGVEVLSSCGRGLCGTCEVGVLAGEPDHRDSLLDDDERRTGDCMYVCVSRSKGPRLVLDL